MPRIAIAIASASGREFRERRRVRRVVEHTGDSFPIVGVDAANLLRFPDAEAGGRRR